MTAEFVTMACTWGLDEDCDDRACMCDCHPDEFYDDALWGEAERDES